MERTDLINKLIKDNGYKSYLEIGISSGINFNGVECDKKISVDPKFEADFKIDSEEFFEINKSKFDIIFIDGLHLAEQVYKDAINSLKALNKKGIILIHDCLPNAEHKQYRERISKDWQGDVWKGVIKLAKDGYKMELSTLESGIILLKKEKKDYKIPKGQLNWEWFVKNFRKIFE
jgi:hypothetical protein